MGLESMSEPDDMDLDEQQEGADEPFFDAQHDRGSSSTSPDTSVKGGAKSFEFDAEDSMGPVTPGPNLKTTFDTGKGNVEKHVDEFDDDDQDEDDEQEDDDEEADDGDDDEWVDPSVPAPSDPIHAPAMSHTKSNDSTSSSGSGSKSKNQVKKSGKRKLGTTPVMQTPELPAHFPFPSSVEDEPQQQQQLDQPPDIMENGIKPRMYTARARDGGRTQSGGVKGVLTADDSENF